MGCKCIFVDWYRTLSLSVFWEQFKEADHPYHDLYEPIRSFLFLESPDLVQGWMRGHLNSEAVVDRLSGALHVDPEMLLQELIVSCQHMRLISENSLGLVTALRSKGIRLVIATDNMDTFHRWTVPSLRLDKAFDSILSSSELHALKADVDDQGRSLFFPGYLLSNSINAGESLLLDDHDETFGRVMQQAGIAYQCLQPGQLDTVLQLILENM